MQNTVLIVLPARCRTFCDTSDHTKANTGNVGPLPQSQSLSAARLPECDGFFTTDHCLIDVESKSNNVGRTVLIPLWLDRRFQQLLIRLVKYGQHLTRHNKDGVLHVLKVCLYCLLWRQVAYFRNKLKIPFDSRLLILTLSRN